MKFAYIVLTVVLIWVLFNNLYLKKNSATLKGKAGEKKVEKTLSCLRKDQYTLINDILISRKDGSTSQIDHVLVSPYGIFVIETKNYSGFITGNEHSERWMWQHYKKKEQFYNPIRQNYGHVKALSEALNVPEIVFKPVVVFSDDAKLNITTDKPVLHMSRLLTYIYSQETEILYRDELPKCVDKIRQLNVVSNSAAKEHVNEIHKKQAKKAEDIKNGICPKCGGNLVLRTGQYGSFYGCSNYPKCHYKRNK